MGLFSSGGDQAVRDEVDALAAEFASLRGAEAERLTRYATYQAELEDARDTPIAQLTGTGQDYGQTTPTAPPPRHNIPLPFGQALTVKHAYRVSQRLPEVTVDRREETPQERYRSETMEKIVWGIIRESKGESQFSDGAWDASKFGAACFEIYFDIDRQMPMFRTLDPGGVLVVRGVNDPHQFRRFFRFWDVPAESVRNDYRDETFRGVPVRVGDIKGTGDQEKVTLVQMADENRVIRFVCSQGNASIPLYENVHNYGFVNYVVIPNIGPQRALWGWSDYEFIRGISQYLPKLFSRQADVIRAVAGGAYKDKKSGQSPKAISNTISNGGVVPVGRDGDIEPIEAPRMPEMLGEHVSTALQYLKMLGFAPDALWGEGDAGSGSDRSLQNQPMLELTALKLVNWGAGMSRLFAMAYRMIESKQASSARYRGAVQRGGRRDKFNLTIDPNAGPATIANTSFDPNDPLAEQEIQVPSSPKQLFDGDYEVGFSWLNRVDPDDPAFVMSELNKFQQAAQSLQTTLERLGVDSPEDEMKLIEQENERFPWLRQGMLKLTQMQLDADRQGEDGGAPVDPGTGLDDALEMMQTKDGAAQDANAGATGLGGSGIGQLYGA